MDKAAKENMESQAATAKTVAGLAAQASTQQGTVDDAAAAAKDAATALKDSIAKAKDTVKAGLTGGSSAVIQKIAQGKTAFDNLVAADKKELSEYLKSEFGKFKVPPSMLSATDDKALKDAKAAQVSVKKSHDLLVAELALHEKCAADGYMYDVATKKCKPLSAPAEKFLNKVYHRMFNNADGRDSGYVTNRYIKFVKTMDDTYVRVFYYDNMRVHGHTSHAIWNIMVCDANGNGCAQCNNPGRLNMNKWSGHQHNWWMIDYMAHTMMGLCKNTDNRALKKGTYQMKVWINHNRYDIYTGHNQQNSFTVDEVVKY